MMLINLMPKRKCFNCKQTKILNQLSFYRSNIRYWQRECIECTKIRRTKWWKSKAGKRSSANTKLKARFGITIEQYEKMIEAVNGKCEICGATCSFNGHRLAIDHDHKTGQIKGILCKACNVGLGNFQENPVLLKRAIEYLNNLAD